MSDTISIAGFNISAHILPNLLSDLGLLNVFVKRLLIRKYTADLLPSRDQQIFYQKSFFSKHSIVTDEDLKQWLKYNDVSEQEMSLHLYRSLQTQLLKKNKFSTKVESYFLENKTDYDLCSYSLIRVSSRSMINELYIRINEEEDTFSSLSEQYSEGPESQTSGFIQLRPFSTIHPEISERLRISRPGQLWQPFQIEESWVLIRLEKFVPSSLDDLTTESILDTLFDSWINQLVSDAISDFKSGLSADSSSIIDYTEFADLRKADLND